MTFWKKPEVDIKVRVISSPGTPFHGMEGIYHAAEHRSNGDTLVVVYLPKVDQYITYELHEVEFHL